MTAEEPFIKPSASKRKENPAALLSLSTGGNGPFINLKLQWSTIMVKYNSQWSIGKFSHQGVSAAIFCHSCFDVSGRNDTSKIEIQYTAAFFINADSILKTLLQN